MKRTVFALVALVFAASVFAGCAPTAEKAAVPTTGSAEVSSKAAAATPEAAKTVAPVKTEAKEKKAK